MRFPLFSTYDEVQTNWVKFTPYAEFGEGAPPGTSILLPAAQGIAISEGVNYNNVELGVIGAGLNRLMNSDNITGEMAALESQAQAATKDTNSLLNSFKVLGANSRAVTNSGIRAAGTLSARKVVNPNTSSLFNGVNIRSFSFSFTLVASSMEERDAIRQIIEHFRINLYPESEGVNGMFSKFPPTWAIDFFYGTGSSQGSKRNEFLPKIHRCFLHSINVTYNSTANSFHSDGSPFDVTAELSFSETKTYSRNNVLTGEGTL